jgi:hypothetical protein
VAVERLLANTSPPVTLLSSLEGLIAAMLASGDGIGLTFAYLGPRDCDGVSVTASDCVGSIVAYGVGWEEALLKLTLKWNAGY